MDKCGLIPVTNTVVNVRNGLLFRLGFLKPQQRGSLIADLLACASEETVNVVSGFHLQFKLCI